MGRSPILMCVAAALLSLAWLPTAANSAPKVAIFPFDFVLPQSEEDFYIGPAPPTEAEKRRLGLAHGELKQLIAAGGRFEPVDLSGISADIEAAAPIYRCNGCEVELAGKAGAELALTSVVDKVSETHLQLNVSIVDVAKSKLVRNASVLIQGNTDEAWLHGVRWLVKNRLSGEESSK